MIKKLSECCHQDRRGYPQLSAVEWNVGMWRRAVCVLKQCFSLLFLWQMISFSTCRCYFSSFVLLHWNLPYIFI